MMTIPPIRFQANGPQAEVGLEYWEPVLADPAAGPLPIQRGATYFTDDAAGYSTGVWESTAFVGVMAPYPVHEFMIVLEGEVTIVHKSGERTIVSAGKSFFLPKGLECQWRQDGVVRKYFAVFENGNDILSHDACPSLIVDGFAELPSIEVNPSDPLLGATPTLRAKTAFSAESEQWRIGVWQSGPYQRRLGPFPRHELMHVLEGQVTVTDAVGTSQTFSAGDTFFIGKDIVCDFVVSEHLRKIYCILDRPVASPDVGQAKAVPELRLASRAE